MRRNWAGFGMLGGLIKAFDLASALTGLEAALRLVDHIDAAFAAHEAVVTMPPAQRFQ
jgi:hypothetical protein